MRLINKKGDAATSETPYVVLAVVLLVLGLSIFLLIKSNFLNDFSARETLCYFSNNMKSGGGAFTMFPSLCSLEIVEDPVNLEDFSAMLRKTWWMYLQGTDDFGNAGDDVFPVYQFVPSEDIKLADFFGYSFNHSYSAYTDDISKSNYAYLEKNTPDNTLCFENIHEGNSLSEYYLKKGETYYILFYDNQFPHDEDWGDKILISSDPDFDAGQWKTMLTSYAIVETATLVSLGAPIVVAAGYGIAFYATSDIQEDSCVYYAIVGNPEAEA